MKHKFSKNLFIIFILFIVLLPIRNILSIGTGIYLGFHSANYALDDNELLALNKTMTQRVSKSEYLVGVYIDFELYTYNSFLTFSIQSDIFYTSKGAKYQTKHLSGIYRISSVFNFHYIELPLLLKIKLTFLPFSAYILTGVGESFLYKAVRNNTNIYTLDKNEIDITNRFRTLDTNIIVGGGLSLQTHKFIEIFTEFRYSFGLLNSYKNVLLKESLRHSNIYITIGGGLRLERL